MASVSKEPSGKYRVQFDCPKTGKRMTLRLPVGDGKVARTIAVHVEHLLNSKVTGLPLPQATASWLSSVQEPLRSRMIKAGLLDSPEAGEEMTLGWLVDDYLKRQTHVKPASKLAMQYAARNLLEFFGPNCPIDSITAGTADDFRKWLLSDGRSGRQQRKSENLAGATVAKRLQRCNAIFSDAIKRKLLSENPFAGMKRPTGHNRDRQAYVPVETVERLIAEQAPNAEWRLLLAMARYLGVRVPSEPFSMTWDCVDWDKQRIRIPSPKTAVHGKSFRVMPILPQVKPYLEAAYEQAHEGTTYIFHQLRQRDSVKAAEKGFWMNLNLRQQLTRMLTRAGIQPWPRLWHNLRASAQTDLANRFPAHVVCEWLGNTQAVARQHYLQTTDEHFSLAIKTDAKSDVQPTQNPTLQATEQSCSEQKSSTETQDSQGVTQPTATQFTIAHRRTLDATGFEQPQNLARKPHVAINPTQNPTYSTPISEDLAYLSSVWNRLTKRQRMEILAFVRLSLAENSSPRSR